MSHKRYGESSPTRASEFYVTAEILNVPGRSGEKSASGADGIGEQKIDGSDILVAAGRIPNTAGIGLEQTGVKVDGRGYIRVNDRLETTAAGIWALGECAGSPQFTHVSEDDFRIVRDNLSRRKSQHARPVDPILHVYRSSARPCGLSEGEAERQGVIVRVARLPVDRCCGRRRPARDKAS